MQPGEVWIRIIRRRLGLNLNDAFLVVWEILRVVNIVDSDYSLG